MKRVQNVLGFLGVTRNYRGYQRIAFAISLVLQNENRLCSVCTEVYQRTAEEFMCTKCAAERAMRTVVQKVWDSNRDSLNRIAGYQLKYKPTVSEFLAIVYNYIKCRE